MNKRQWLESLSDEELADWIRKLTKEAQNGKQIK